MEGSRKTTMRRLGLFGLLTIVALSIIACSTNTPQAIEVDRASIGTYSPEVQLTMQAVIDKQSQGLANAVVSIKRAYNYRGFTYMQSVEGAKLIAVDVRFADYQDGIDLDDIDIIDGGTNENYGSDPDIIFLTDEGDPFPDNKPTQDFGEPIRVMLIYAVRETTVSIKLAYWGKEIWKEPYILQDNGPEMPKH
jgi:hypothetical protein